MGSAASPPSIRPERAATYLGDGVSQQVRVPGGVVENTERNSVGRPLDLMNHSLRSQRKQSD